MLLESPWANLLWLMLSSGFHNYLKHNNTFFLLHYLTDNNHIFDYIWLYYKQYAQNYHVYKKKKKKIENRLNVIKM